MQIILSPAESAAVTRAIKTQLHVMEDVADGLPVDESEWLDEQLELLRGVIDRTKAAQTPIKKEKEKSNEPTSV